MTSLSHVIISSCQKALTMNLANGVHEFFFKRISHVRALHILKSALRGCEPAARGFIGWHGYLKVMASVNIETAYEQTSF